MTVSGNGAGDGEGADSAGGAAGAAGVAGPAVVAGGAGVLGAGALSPTADADFSTAAVVVVTAAGDSGTAVVLAAAGDSWMAVVVSGVAGAALVGVVVCWLCAEGAALDVPDSVTGEVAADPDVGVPDVAPEVAEVSGAPAVV